MTNVFDEIRDELARLRRDRPGVVLGSGETKRVHVELAAHETEVAARLHETYAPFLDITVGAFRYPFPERSTRQPLPSADMLTVQWGGETPSALSGAALHVDAVVTNTSAARVELHTDGDLRGEVVDPISRELVGRFVGPHVQPLVIFAIDPGQARNVPVLIGTASGPVAKRVEWRETRRVVRYFAPLDGYRATRRDPGADRPGQLIRPPSAPTSSTSSAVSANVLAMTVVRLR